VDEKKALFFRALLPLVLAENDRVQRQRERLLEAFRTPELRADGEQAPFVEKLMAANDLEGDINDPELRSKLLRRVDTVPPALALAQAANESGWGSSRFAKEANNLFGEWTWNARHGIAPRDRPEGRRYFVRVFPTLRDSVKSYVNNLNTNPAYIELRALRADARDAGIRPTAKRLAAGLKRYSSRGKEYVAEIRAMIRHNELQGIAANAALASPTALASAE
jgi:Bax protein